MVFAPAGDLVWRLPFSAAPESQTQPATVTPLPIVPADGSVERTLRHAGEHPAHAGELLGAVACPEDVVAWYRRLIGKVALLRADEEVELARRIEAGLAAEHRLASGGAPDGEVRDLESIAADGQRARQHLVEANLRLVVHEAHRFSGHGLDLPDLIQNGNLGLMHAVDLFDYRLGNKFSTYATHWIRQAMQRGIANQARTVRLPVHRVQELKALGDCRTKLSDTLCRDPSAEELARAMDVSTDAVEALLAIEPGPVSLDIEVPTGFDACVPLWWQPLGGLIEDGDAPSAFDFASHTSLKDRIEWMLEGLSVREADVVRQRFGLCDGQPRTLREIGEAFRLSPERIRQIESRALAKLQHPSRSQALMDYVVG